MESSQGRIGPWSHLGAMKGSMEMRFSCEYLCAVEARFLKSEAGVEIYEKPCRCRL